MIQHNIKIQLSNFQVLLFNCLAFILFSSCGNTTESTEDPDSVTTYHIYCDSADFNSLYSDWENSFYIPVVLKHDGQTYRNLKMRLRGDTSRELPKKSLKIKPDGELLPDNKTSINLNAEYTDLSMIRQALSSKLFKRSGHSCFKTNYAEVYLNDEFLGVYLEVENMDDAFLRRNGFDPKGNLYKATNDGACLSIHDNLSEDWENKTKKKREFGDLAVLVDQINKTPDDEFREMLQQNFDYESLINILAMNMFIANGSTYYHNYHLFHDINQSGKWYMFPWDLDKTISYYGWKPYQYHETSSYWESDNPLVERCFLDDEIMKDIQNRLNELADEVAPPDVVAHLVDSLKSVLNPILMRDTTNRIDSEKNWLVQLDQEKKFLANHRDQILGQMNDFPKPFKLVDVAHMVSDSVRLNWNASSCPSGNDITYTVRYGTHHLLPDSVSEVITGLTDTTYTIRDLAPNKQYYWRVRASNGEHEIDGFNTKNIIQTKKGVLLQGTLNSDRTLTQEESPYIVSGVLKIKGGVTLTAQPGAQLLMQPNSGIEVNGGIIQLAGTHEKPILMNPVMYGDDWGVIMLYTPQDTAVFEHIHLSEGQFGASNASLRIAHCDLLIDYKKLTYMKEDELVRESWIYTSNCELEFIGNELIGNNTGEGLNAFDSRVLAKGNFVDNCPDALEIIGCTDSEMAYNYVENNSDDGIDMNACHNVKIHHNRLFNIHDKAMSIGSEQYGFSDSISVYSNLVFRARDGVGLKDSSFASISGNTFVHCHTGIRLFLKKGKYDYGGTATVENNSFYGCEHLTTADEYSELNGNQGHVIDPECDLSGLEKGQFKLPVKCFEEAGPSHGINRLSELNNLHMTAINRDKCCGIQIQNPNAYTLSLNGFHVMQNGQSIYQFPSHFNLHPYHKVYIGNCKKGHLPSDVLFVHTPEFCDLFESSAEFELRQYDEIH